MSKVEPSAAVVLAKSQNPSRHTNTFEETLSKLPFIPHEIDDYGHISVPRSIKANTSIATEEKLLDYISGIYLKNEEAKKRFMSNGKLHLNLSLKELGVYNPVGIIQGNVLFLDKISALKRPVNNLLLNSDPRLALALITSNDCGVKNYDPLARRGALCIIAGIIKHLEYKIIHSKEITPELIEDINAMLMANKVIEQYNDSEKDVELVNLGRKLEEESEEIEKKIYAHCSTLSSKTEKSLTTKTL